MCGGGAGNAPHREVKLGAEASEKRSDNFWIMFRQMEWETEIPASAQFSLIFMYFFWLRWVFVAAHGLSLVAVSRGYSSLRWAGFSLRWLFFLWSTGSRHAVFSSCGTQALLLHGMWDLPGLGIEPVSPALAGRFLTTAPPGKFPLTDI